jgi:hypothetical protein
MDLLPLLHLLEYLQTSDVFGGACGPFDIFTDGSKRIPAKQICFEPVFHGGLENFYYYHPHGTLMLVTRNLQDWLSSVYRWYVLHDRLAHHCHGPGYFTQWKGKNVTDDDILQMYMDHVNTVRSFAQAHPSLTYIEVELESNQTGQILEDRIGISRECWGQHNVNTLKPKEVRKI